MSQLRQRACEKERLVVAASPLLGGVEWNGYDNVNGKGMIGEVCF
jgi:hypothetical protein